MTDLKSNSNSAGEKRQNGADKLHMEHIRSASHSILKLCFSYSRKLSLTVSPSAAGPRPFTRALLAAASSHASAESFLSLLLEHSEAGLCLFLRNCLFIFTARRAGSFGMSLRGIV